MLSFSTKSTHFHPLKIRKQTMTTMCLYLTPNSAFIHHSRLDISNINVYIIEYEFHVPFQFHIAFACENCFSRRKPVRCCHIFVTIQITNWKYVAHSEHLTDRDTSLEHLYESTLTLQAHPLPPHLVHTPTPTPTRTHLYCKWRILYVCICIASIQINCISTSISDDGYETKASPLIRFSTLFHNSNYIH